MSLPPQQTATLDTVKRYLFECGFPPSLAEIARELRIAKPTAQVHVGRLVDKGELERVGGRLLLPKGQNPHELIQG